MSTDRVVSTIQKEYATKEVIMLGPIIGALIEELLNLLRTKGESGAKSNASTEGKSRRGNSTGSSGSR